VVYGEECLDNIPVDIVAEDTSKGDGQLNKKMPNGSIVTVTATAGMLLASLILRDVQESLAVQK